MTDDVLVEPVHDFVDEVTAALSAIASGRRLDAAKLRDDVALECFQLCAGFVDADGRATDDELRALVVALGPMVDTPLAGATPDAIRRSGLVRGKRSVLDQPSELFTLLLDADRQHGTAGSHVYYRTAVDLGFAVASIDMHTSDDELESIERFRGGLLGAMQARSVRRPGQPAPAPGPPTAAATAGPGPASPPEEPLPPPRTLDDLLAELDELIGMAEVKREVRRTVDLTRIEQLRQKRGLPVMPRSRHMVFTGNPGTGKTTVARLLSQFYRTLNVVKKGHLIETERSQLVAGYVGQTAMKVREVFDRADGGTLLIDEAYALIRGGENDFGREAIDTVVKLVEDRRDSVIVIAAGYPEEMATFVELNPGLRSRFPKTVHFPDYSTDELIAIAELLGKKQRYQLDDGARAKFRDWLDAQPRTKGFGNGRLARNLFEAAVARQATRLVGITEPTDDQLVTLTADDIPAIGESF